MARRFSVLGTVGNGVLALLVATAPPSAMADPPAAWRSAAPLPHALQEVGSVALGDNVYVAGGLGTPAELFSNHHLRFDTRTGEWRQLAPIPVAQHHLQGVAVDGKIYYLGGEEGAALIPNGRVWEYDPATDRFTQRTGMPADRIRGAAGVAAHDGRIYVAGGYNGLAAALPYFDVYDPATDTWAALPDMPNAREHLGAAVVDGKFYAVGGRFVIQPAFVRPTDVFDFGTRTWSTGWPIPRGRGGLGVAAIGQRIYAFGGEGIGPAFDYTDVLDTATMTWSPGPPMPLGRHGIQAATVGRDLFLAGGAEISAYWPAADVQVFQP
ncbi:Kelch repeat-containing protein [Nocardia sp. NPDC052566]|uniref:Kelch repeat-containing protein n=1 Tax=Nocardia sp. NPDC052566 TaxID=3364330 RepID=UPI0037CA366D